MNRIEIRKHTYSTGVKYNVFYIDGKPLYEYLTEWLSENPDLLDRLAPLDDLEICWSDNYDWEGDSLFMKYVLSKEQAITPILSCPDDFDFSCIVIVADVVKTGDVVRWRRIRSVNHSRESFFEEKKSGILLTEAYTKEDWEKYGDNIALAKVDSREWGDWISNNWTEELYRRRINYTYPYYQNEDNIDWIADCCFEFDKAEYDRVVEKCYSE